ncbi:hypothetical protein GH714_022033 [Hevea brasiliensis]|uniref:Uncharacterized protein n=1 Tax=Hevea brasiliensis TaxID=3981 RepID=A0A6A6KWS4_HEVBR|nr:hypothetical protein GH714_022033 [Hevea brasiliensis]
MSKSDVKVENGKGKEASGVDIGGDDWEPYDDEPVIEPSLPLNFTFGTKEQVLVEKSENEKELEELWAEMSLSLCADDADEDAVAVGYASLEFKRREVSHGCIISEEPVSSPICNRGVESSSSMGSSMESSESDCEGLSSELGVTPGDETSLLNVSILQTIPLILTKWGRCMKKLRWTPAVILTVIL